jgi:Uma2 family endonuclease
MTTATAKRLMTVEEFLALPDDGVRRWLIDGEVREYGMTVRNRDHSRVMMRVGQLLGNWLDARSVPRGEVVGGEAGFILPGDAGQVVGIDVAYIDPDLAARKPDDTTLFEGVPILAVEVLSPSDTQEYIRDRVASLLKAGVKVVWIVDPDEETVRVRRKGRAGKTFDNDEELSGEPELPGFRVPVASLFSRG